MPEAGRLLPSAHDGQFSYRILAKMKLAILSALVAGAAAFAPAQEAKQTTALAAFENEREF